ncbi:hypothetical protein D3C75_960640 [compost metagenome]
MLEQAICNVGAVGGGKIQIPLAVDKVQFRCPDQRAHWPLLRLSPYDPCCGLRQFVEAARPAKLQAIVFRHRGGEIVIAISVAQNKGIGPLFDKGIRVVSHYGLLTGVWFLAAVHDSRPVPGN